MKKAPAKPAKTTKSVVDIRYEELRRTVSNLIAGQKSIFDRLRTIEAAIETVSATTTALSAEDRDLSGDIASLKGDVNRINAISQAVGRHNEFNNSVSREFSELKQRLDALESMASRFDGFNRSHANAVSNLTTSFGDLAERLAATVATPPNASSLAEQLRSIPRHTFDNDSYVRWKDLKPLIKELENSE